MREIFFLYPFYRWEDLSRKKLSTLPNPHHANGGGRI